MASPFHRRRDAIGLPAGQINERRKGRMSIRRMKLAGMIFAVALLSFVSGTIAQGRYPDINRAEGALQAALADLRAARNVFGGHKANAEGLVNQAIGELEA